MPRPKKTEQQLQSTRELILDTAYTILQEDGPQAITSRAIAERMGIAHMSLYTYFENQPAILRALGDRELAKMRTRLHVFEQRAKTEAVQTVVADLLQFLITFARENPNQFHLAWVMPEIGSELVEQTRQRMYNTVEQLAHLIQTGIEKGEFAEREPFLAAATVLGMVNTPYILFHSGKLANPVLRDHMTEEVIFAAMLYLKSPNKDRPEK